MMIPSNYSVNLARAISAGFGGAPAYKHFARIELGPTYYHEAIARYEEFVRRFPAADGWSVTLDFNKCSGETISRSEVSSFSEISS